MMQPLPLVTAPPDFQQQAKVLKALAHPLRLRLVYRLHAGECSVGELTEVAGLDRTTVSKHLALLKRVGIVGERRAGRLLLHTLRTPCVLQFFSCASQVLGEAAPGASA